MTWRCDGSRAAAKRRRAAGFTLIELLVVLAILALVLAIVPELFAGASSVRLRQAADGMVATLRELHAQAIRRQQTTELILDPGARRYRLSTESEARPLPNVVTGVAFTTVALRPGDSVARVLFFPDGSASGGTIRLNHGELSATITVDWLSGRVKRRG